MSRVCQVTGKRPRVGFKYVTRGIAKKKKGIGLKTTGKTRRRFLPNLVTKRFWYPQEKRFVSLKLTMAGMRNIEKLGLHAVVSKLRTQGVKV